VCRKGRTDADLNLSGPEKKTAATGHDFTGADNRQRKDIYPGIDRGQDHAAFVDHPTSGHALAATLASLRRLTPGRLVVLAEEAAVARL
jgi:hypothetical protein